VEMLLAVLSVCSEEELEDTSSEEETSTIPDLAMTPSELAQRRQQIKNKVLAMGRMQRVFQILRCVCITFLLPGRY
jgi:serine/threonine-protein phosphatase 2B catalytic subunit